VSEQHPPQQPQQPTWAQQPGQPMQPAPWGPPPPPKKSSAGKVIGIIVGVFVACLVLLGGCAVLISDAGNNVDSSSSASGDKPKAADDKGVDDGTVGLTDKVTYENGVAVQLSGFERGTSSEYAAPSSTAYVKFTVNMVNGSKKTVNASMLAVQCQYGKAPAHEGEQVFDVDKGLDVPPTTHVTPGNSISFTMACAMPKDEQRLQVEVSPGFLSDTALFVGAVK
jgi:hypothetical protein